MYAVPLGTETALSLDKLRSAVIGRCSFVCEHILWLHLGCTELSQAQIQPSYIESLGSSVYSLVCVCREGFEFYVSKY